MKDSDRDQIVLGELPTICVICGWPKAFICGRSEVFICG